MVKTNFDVVVPRRGTNSYKWDEETDAEVLPLWVADMDFPTAPVVREAVSRRAAHGVFGYTMVPDAYYDSVIRWFSRRHGWHIRREWMQYTIGVVPALSCIIKALTMPGDKVLVTTPVYNCFFSSIRNNGCEVVEEPLVVRDGKYVIDFEAFESDCADSKVVAFLLCNPHNPGGRVWTRGELEHIGDICRRHGVWVISDEIHNELVMPGFSYTPFASVSAANQSCSITCISPSKSFNTAGLQIANIVCSDPVVSRRIDRAVNINEVCDVNPFGVVATMAAYSAEGEQWLTELNAYIAANNACLQQFFARLDAEGFPMQSMPLEGTYLAWIDCSQLCRRLGLTADGLVERLKREAKVWFNSGTMYGRAGEGFIRINMACPRSTLTEALDRFERFLKK